MRAAGCRRGLGNKHPVNRDDSTDNLLNSQSAIQDFKTSLVLMEVTATEIVLDD